MMLEDFPYISSDEVLPTVKAWERDHNWWHFHMLNSGCIYNAPDYSVCSILLENVSTHVVRILRSEHRNMELGEQLARLCHSEVFTANLENPPANWVQQWLQRMQQLNRLGVPWHHHLLFPDCRLNRNRNNRWVLIFEDPQNGEVLEHESEEMPTPEFRAIENVYWGQQRVP
jgi:hypothetical protein